MRKGQRLRIEPGSKHHRGLIASIENNQPFYFNGEKQKIIRFNRTGKYVFIDIEPLN